MNDNKKIAINSIIIYVRLCVVSLISVILSRVVLDALGASDFGLYNVVGGIVLLLNVLNSSMTSTTYRYLAFEIGKGESGDPNKIFNTSRFIHLFFAILIILIGEPIGEYYILHYLNVLPESIPNAQFVFRLSIISAAINTFFVPNQGLLVAYEKFNVTGIIDIVTNIIKLLLVYLFIYSEGNRIQIYSVIMLSYTILNSLFYHFYCLRYYPSVTSYRRVQDKALYKDMISFSGWTLFGAFANVGKTQGCTIIINFFFGTIVNAAYAVANQIETFIMSFARTLNSVAVPQITKSYSSGDSNRSITLTSYVSKYTFLLMAFISFPIMLEMDFLLSIWLKEVPVGAGTFCCLITLGNLIGCLGEGIPNLINASGKIKAYQVVVHTILIAGLPISWMVYKLGANPYAICIVYCIINFVNSFVKMGMLRRVVEFDIIAFIKTSHLRIILVSVPLLVYFIAYQKYIHLDSPIGHILGMLFSVLVFLFIVFLLGLETSERKVCFKYIKSIASKLIKK